MQPSTALPGGRARACWLLSFHAQRQATSVPREEKFPAQYPNTLIPVGDFLIGSCGMAYGWRTAILLVSTELPDASTGSTGSTIPSKYTRTRREDRQGDFGEIEAIPLPLGTVMITITSFTSHDVRFPASNFEVYNYHWTTLTAGPKTSRIKSGPME